MGDGRSKSSARECRGVLCRSFETLLLALTSILFALFVFGLIPFLARRIVHGDVGSTMFAIVGVAATAATMAAQAAMGAIGGFGRYYPGGWRVGVGCTRAVGSAAGP
jgi:hypothetical protein